MKKWVKIISLILLSGMVYSGWGQPSCPVPSNTGKYLYYSQDFSNYTTGTVAVLPELGRIGTGGVFNPGNGIWYSNQSTMWNVNDSYTYYWGNVWTGAAGPWGVRNNDGCIGLTAVRQNNANITLTTISNHPATRPFEFFQYYNDLNVWRSDPSNRAATVGAYARYSLIAARDIEIEFETKMGGSDSSYYQIAYKTTFDGTCDGFTNISSGGPHGNGKYYNTTDPSHVDIFRVSLPNTVVAPSDFQIGFELKYYNRNVPTDVEPPSQFTNLAIDNFKIYICPVAGRLTADPVTAALEWTKPCNQSIRIRVADVYPGLGDDPVNGFSLFQWESSTDSISWTNIPDSTCRFYTTPPTLSQTTWYRCKVWYSPDGCPGVYQPSPFKVIVPDSIMPTFSGAQTVTTTYCAGNTPVPAILPTTSTNGIPGTWNLSTINTSVLGNSTYTFTPNAGQCAKKTEITVTVTDTVTPTFSDAQAITTTYCIHETPVPATLPTISTNEIRGSWNNPVINTATTTSGMVYTFTPTSGTCINNATITVTVTDTIIPAFAFGTPLFYCLDAAPISLPTTSTNGITGTWNPSTINTSVLGDSTYTFTPNAGQCAGTYTLSVTVGTAIIPTFNISLAYCVGAPPTILPATSTNGITGTWNSSTINTSVLGDSTYTFTPNAGQCADATTITVTVSKPVFDTAYVITGQPYFWAATGLTYNTSSIHSKLYHGGTVGGCDSTAVLNLTIMQPATGYEYVTACDNFYWAATNTTYELAGTYYRFFPGGSVYGSDSTAVLVLTLHRSRTVYLSQSACDNYYWAATSVTYVSSGTYTKTYTNPATGCDSTLILNLTIGRTAQSIQQITSCDSFYWQTTGLTYHTSGVYAKHYTNFGTGGCDSIAILYLTIPQKITTDYGVVACEVYTWEALNENFTESGIYLRHFTAANSCDSAVTLHLTIIKTTYTTFKDTACNQYDWAGEVFTESGNYVKTFLAATGCDSVVTLRLHIYKTFKDTLFAETCTDYIWRDSLYSESGIYDRSVYSPTGCDSIFVLHLTVHDTPYLKIEIIEEDFCVENYAVLEAQTNLAHILWNTRDTSHTLLITKPGTYTARANSRGCESVADSLTTTMDCNYTIYIPNAIIPETNWEENAYFYIKYANNHQIESLDANIYNRWGHLVFKSNDVNFKWDGREKGKFHTNTTYVYKIMFYFKNGKSRLYTGIVTVL